MELPERTRTSPAAGNEIIDATCPYVKRAQEWSLQ